MPLDSTSVEVPSACQLKQCRSVKRQYWTQPVSKCQVPVNSTSVKVPSTCKFNQCQSVKCLWTQPKSKCQVPVNSTTVEVSCACKQLSPFNDGRFSAEPDSPTNTVTADIQWWRLLWYACCKTQPLSMLTLLEFYRHVTRGQSAKCLWSTVLKKPCSHIKTCLSNGARNKRVVLANTASGETTKRPLVHCGSWRCYVHTG